ncbi:Trafficking protein particle complex subunit 13 [Homalodisca vitripennis]|nr:Trafficking protein particle complex subunit 13 [Homalodisca vitripennis]
MLIERSLDIVLKLEPCAGLAWCGVSGRQLGKLEPAQSVHINLTVVPLMPGLQWPPEDIIAMAQDSSSRIDSEESEKVNAQTELVSHLVAANALDLALHYNISGIRLVDTFLKRTYEYDELAQVFVTQKDTDFLQRPVEVQQTPAELHLTSTEVAA